MSTVEQKPKTRKAPARSTDVVLAVLEERLKIALNGNSEHSTRIDELFDELKRSLRKGEEVSQ
jgi:hypothetical protein